MDVQDKSELNLEEGTKIELLANKQIKLGSASVERITMTIIGANSEDLKGEVILAEGKCSDILAQEEGGTCRYPNVIGQVVEIKWEDISTAYAITETKARVGEDIDLIDEEAIDEAIGGLSVLLLYILFFWPLLLI